MSDLLQILSDGQNDPSVLHSTTGAGVRIAVIDSGVRPDHPHIDARQLEPGIAISPDGIMDDVECPFLDRLGHGTAVMAAIQEKAPAATYIPIRVFGHSLKTSPAAVVDAIRWAITQKVHLINLSLGSTNPVHAEGLTAAVREAGKSGIKIIAAQKANDIECYPGALPDVIGVVPDWDISRDSYRILSGPEKIILAASGYPRPIPGLPKKRNLTGVSFAVAQITGFAACLIQRERSKNC